MTKTKSRLSLHSFIFLVGAAALLGGGYDAWVSRGQSLSGPRPDMLAIFAACCFVTELRPLRWLRITDGGQVTASWTFMMALLLIGTPVVAVSLASGAVLVSDLIYRKALVKVLFNFAQIILALTLAAAVLVGTGQDQALRLQGAPALVWFPVFLSACAIAFVVNNSLTCAVMALHQGLPVRQIIRDSGATSLSTDGVLLSLSPIFVVVAERSVLLVPLLLVTTWTVYRTAEVALVRRHEATHDPLTQLPNRRLFDEHLHSAVLSAQRAGTRVGVVVIDLNGFKGINDRLGHDIGDQVLRSIATRMNNARRSADLLARIGGDEFAVVISRLDSVATATRVAERMQATFSSPCMVEGFPVSVDASFGVAVLPDHAHDTDTLLQRADETMYSSKQGDQGVTVYDASAEGPTVGRIGLLADVAGALRGDEFFLEYQPQVSLVTGMPVGVEALVRWRHPIAGVLYPAEFIGLAEQTELMGDITEQVLRRAMNQCVAWRRLGQPLRMAINVSARNLQDVRFPELVASLVKETGVDPSAVDLEITENTVGLEAATIRWVMTRLRSIGVSISIDDFGTGYSSMAQLRELPVDRIKIDRSFVTNMASEERNALIVKAIVQLALALGVQTIAEGVEDAKVAQMLLEVGCTTAQGWLYGRPEGPDVLTRLWAAGANPIFSVPRLELRESLR